MPADPRRVYIDFDDVLCATARGFLVVLEREFGKTVRFDEIVDFDLKRSFDLTPLELERFFDLVHEDDCLLGFEPIENAFETIREWRDAGLEIDVVTGRPPATRASSEAWLEAHDVAYDDLIFVEKYGHAPGGVPLASILGSAYSWVVEDSFEMASRMASAGHRVHLLDRPWNRLEFDSGVEVVRCGDWHELRSTVPL